MRVLLFGGEGQLGQEFRKKSLELHLEIAAPVMSEVDISSAEQVSFLIDKLKPEVVVNCAAYTAVDPAEQNRALAFAVNRDGVLSIARAAKRVGARVIHISTDYVFPGTGNRPLSESDPVAPLNVYGESKLAGEQVLLELMPESGLVVRTSSLHGQYGSNFVHTMIKLFTEKEVIPVVDDQWMSPTWAGWLAEVLLDLVRIETSGILHASGGGATTWHAFACKIYELAREQIKGCREVNIKPIKALEFARPAARPMYSVFDCSRLTQVLGRAPIPWEYGLRSHLKEIGLLGADQE